MCIIHLEILAKNNMIEQFEQEFMDKEEKYELTWDDIKDQLNEDKPINELKLE